jgi:hypothetical protein
MNSRQQGAPSPSIVIIPHIVVHLTVCAKSLRSPRGMPELRIDHLRWEAPQHEISRLSPWSEPRGVRNET